MSKNNIISCHYCNTKENLKSCFIALPADRDAFFISEVPPNNSVCKKCFLNRILCDTESTHYIADCILDSDCPNHESSKEYYMNWNNYDYDWNESRED